MLYTMQYLDQDVAAQDLGAPMKRQERLNIRE